MRVGCGEVDNCVREGMGKHVEEVGVFCCICFSNLLAKDTTDNI